MKGDDQMKMRRLVLVSTMALAVPVLLVIGWLGWRNRHRMDVFDAILIAAVPAMFGLHFGLDWLIARPSVKRLTVRVPLANTTREHLNQTAPFVIFVFFAALVAIPKLVWWDAMLRLLAFWFVIAAVVEIWSRYRANA